IVVVCREAFWRQFDRGYDFVLFQIRIELRCVAWQAVEVAERDAALAIATGCQYARVQRRQCDAHIRWVGRDAMLAGAKDCMHAIEPVDGRAAASRLTLIARR